MTERQTTWKILIVDDHPMVREGMVMRISGQHDLQVCGQAEGEDDALALVKDQHPDLIIVDISLKTGHGISLIKQVSARHPQVKMLVVSGFQESLYAERALRAGALGYLNKQESSEKLLEAIHTVLKGTRYVSPEVARCLIEQALSARADARTPVEQLSDRELEIFRMIGQGTSSSAIANTLHLSTHTIDTHRENIKRKLGAHSAAELTRQAVQWVLENG